MRFLFTYVATIAILMLLSLKIWATPLTVDAVNTIRQYLLNNITTADNVVVKENNGRIIRSLPGAVLASPSNKGKNFEQDYQFHWVRDAAIGMQEVVYLYTQASGDNKQALYDYLINYINFENKTQHQVSRAGQETLGQPKFNLDATIYEGEWGRPQNDGPALRAMTLMMIAEVFLAEKKDNYIHDILLPMITLDLNYVCMHWRDASFDLWEEVYDVDHFYTKMVQRKALIRGSELMRSQGDQAAAENYRKTADQISQSLESHWNSARGYFTETINQQSYKGGGLDTSILLGVLHGDLVNPEDSFALNNERVMSSIFFLRNAFATLYRINIENPQQAPMLGRYPSDVYDGDQFLYGNPWILVTNGLAEYYYKLANIYLKTGKIVVTQNNLLFFHQLNINTLNAGVILVNANPKTFYAIVDRLVEEGDHLLLVTKQYSTCTSLSCYHLSEQIDRASGKQVSARDLTWSYASLLSAMRSRYEV